MKEHNLQRLLAASDLVVKVTLEEWDSLDQETFAKLNRVLEIFNTLTNANKREIPPSIKKAIKERFLGGSPSYPTLINGKPTKTCVACEGSGRLDIKKGFYESKRACNLCEGKGWVYA